MRHTVRVQADSLYEAAARGLRALRAHGWMPTLELSKSRLEIVVSEPAKTHSIRLSQFERWLDSSGTLAPKDFLRKAKIRDLLSPPLPGVPPAPSKGRR
jgi:hypothetical protein